VSLEEQNLIDETILNAETLVQKDNRKDQQQDATTCATIGEVYSEEELNEGLQEVKGSGLSEDVGRYIGFGRKEFTKKGNGVYALAKLLFPTSKHCYGLNSEAKLLCENGKAIDEFEIATLKQLYEQIGNSDSEASVLLQHAVQAYDEKLGTSGVTFNPQEFRDEIVALRQYYQAHSIKSDETTLAIPYRYLIPLNIVFNWSLQNLSSYYTDIGFAWVMLFIVLIIALPYALVKKDKNLITLSLTALLGRGIWWIIGGGILRYGTVLISRTLLTVLVFANTLYEESKKSLHQPATLVAGAFIGIVLLGIVIQLFLNFFRISSQGASGPFVWYKGNVGNETQFSETLTAQTKIKYGYTMKNVFDLQFPQYNAIINALKDRNNEDGIVVAGTYIQYFLDNQWNLK
jgi:hypothetical protein